MIRIIMTDCTISTSQKQERIVKQNRQHIKPTQISIEQYLCDQLHKHTKTDPLESILTQLEKQPPASNNNNSIYNGPHRNTTYGHSMSHKELDINQRKCGENNEPKISENRILVSRPVDSKDKDLDSAVWTRYGRII